MTYFNNVCTLEELRKQYKELLKTHHPDNGGNVAQMQEVNAEDSSSRLKRRPGTGTAKHSGRKAIRR